MSNIDISKLNKAEVLAALYNASKQQGLGFLNPLGAQLMTKEQAAEEHPESNYFDYLHGRVMNVDLTGNTLNPDLYDRDNGPGAAQRALAPLVSK